MAVVSEAKELEGSNRKYEHQNKWIPDDIIMDILSRLPARSVVRFRCVCRRWNSLTRDPLFINMHLGHAHMHIPSVLIHKGTEVSGDVQNSKLNLYSLSEGVDGCSLDAITTIEKYEHRWPARGHCNGLICMVGKTDIVVLNLTTQESVTVPKCPRMPDYLDIDVFVAFQPSTGRYMLVWKEFMGYDACDYLIYGFETITLGGSETWRTVTTAIRYRFDGFGLCVDGIIYYVIDVAYGELMAGIVSIDLEHWNFKDVPFPCSEIDRTKGLFHLYSIRGNLYLTSRMPSYWCELSMDIWLLKDAAKGLWSKEYRIISTELFYCLRFTHLVTISDSCIVLGLDEQLTFYTIGKESLVYGGEKLDLRTNVYGYTETLVDVKSFYKTERDM